MITRFIVRGLPENTLEDLFVLGPLERHIRGVMVVGLLEHTKGPLEYLFLLCSFPSSPVLFGHLYFPVSYLFRRPASFHALLLLLPAPIFFPLPMLFLCSPDFFPSRIPVPPFSRPAFFRCPAFFCPSRLLPVPSRVCLVPPFHRPAFSPSRLFPVTSLFRSAFSLSRLQVFGVELSPPQVLTISNLTFLLAGVTVYICLSECKEYSDKGSCWMAARCPR